MILSYDKVITLD